MSQPQPSGLLVLPAGAEPPSWAGGLPEARIIGAEGLDGPLSDVEWAVVDGSAGDPISSARAVREADSELQLIVVAPARSHASLRRTILLTPGLGEVWLRSPEQISGEDVRKAAEVTRSRRGSGRHRERIRDFFKQLEHASPSEPRRVSDAFLAALLRVLPAPVLSLSDENVILSWNPAATALFRRGREQAQREGVFALAAPGQEDFLRQLLDAGRHGMSRGELSLGGGEQARVCEVMVAPVPTGAEGVRVMVVHDITAERAYQRQVEEQASELEMQAEELQAQTEELIEKQAEIERVMQLRARFFATMSHELRTPVNAILGYNDLLLAGVYGKDPKAAERALLRTRSAARHLVELVNDILDLSKLEAGKLDLAYEEVSIPDFLHDLTATVEPMALERDVRLEVEAGECHNVRTDPRRVRQVMLNLVSNAVKFGGGEPVTIRCVPSAYGLALEVEDRGPGIPKELLETVFEEFVQLEAGQDAGTGLGLAISRRLAEALGGRLSVDSEPGRGATFRLELPRTTPEGDPA